MPNPGMSGPHGPVMGKDEWLSPPDVLWPLGPFDLDPCAPEVRPWDTAKVHFSKKDNGLARPWFGRVWLNPPYGREASKWLALLAEHGTGTALIFARTDTDLFFTQVWPKASGLLFLRGRLHFYHVDGTKAAYNSGAPSVLVAYGGKDAQILETCGLAGKFVALSEGLGNA